MRLNGAAGDDTLLGGAGMDVLTGGAGSDTFLFRSLSSAGPDVINDFTVADGDRLGLTDLLENYDPAVHSVENFVQITEDGTDTFIAVNTDGTGDDFTQIAQLKNVTGLAGWDADDLLA